MASVRTVQTPVLDLRFASDDMVMDCSSGKLFRKERRAEEERYSGHVRRELSSTERTRSMDDERPSYYRSSNGPKSPRAGVRRMQRFFNHAQLKKYADPEDLEDPERLKKLFDVNTPSLFRDVVESSQKQKSFEPFLYVTEEMEQEQLGHLHRKEKKRRNASKSCKPDKTRADLRYGQVDRYGFFLHSRKRPLRI